MVTMASIANDRNGTRRVLFVAPDGTRKTIRLGKVDKKTAEGVCRHVEALLAAQIAAQPIPRETALWLAEIGDTLRGKLAAVGLIEERPTWTLGALIETWLQGRAGGLRPGTLVRLEQSRRSALAFFGEGRRIATITPGDAEDFRAWLLSQGLAEATVRKRCSDMRSWLRYAVRRRWIDDNAFEGVPTAAIATDNLRYVSEADARRVLEHIGDPDLRLLFVLARWGGLRVVSEPKLLTWDCVDWERRRLRVPSPKTERYGHGQRIIPLFPELAEPLSEAFERAREGEAFILPKLSRVSSAALRKPIEAAIRRAGLRLWPRLWQNLRSSRQTDLEQRFPGHVVCAWMGNNRQTAQRHYLQVLDSDYERAAQNPAQQGAETSGSTLHKQDPQNPESVLVQHLAAWLSKCTNLQATPTGLEPSDVKRILEMLYGIRGA